MDEAEFETFMSVKTYLRAVFRKDKANVWKEKHKDYLSFVAERIERDRFWQLSQHLTIDPAVFLPALESRFLSLRKLPQYVTLDETIVAYWGQDNPFWVYVKEKPHTTGMKLWVIQAHDSYCYALDLYHKQKEATDDTLMRMVGRLPHGDTVIIADAYFGAESAAEKLSRTGRQFILKCKSVRPSFLFKNRLHHSVACGDLAYAWKRAGRDTIFAMTYAQPSQRRTYYQNFLTNCLPPRMERVAGNSSMKLPCVWLTYKLHRVNVDESDKTVRAMRSQLRYTSWQQALLDWVLGLALQNAWVLYNETRRVPEPRSLWLRRLAEELGPDPDRAEHRTFLLGKRRHCSECRARGVYHEAKRQCYDCPGQPNFAAACFQQAHDRAKS